MSPRPPFPFEPLAPPLIVGAVHDPGDPSPDVTFVVEFDQAMDQDGGDDAANWVLHPSMAGPFIGSALVWDDATHLRIHTSPGVPVPPFTGDYTQPGGDVRSAAGVDLASVFGFPVG